MRLSLTLFACILPLVGCHEDTLDTELGQVIQQQHLTGDPSPGHNLPSISTPKAQLGMKLFFSKALGGDLKVACASCHHPLLGGGDNLSLSIGVHADKPDLLGANRTLESNRPLGVPRNAPSTFNVGLWNQALFHDGRIGQMPEGITTPDVPYPQPDLHAGNNLVYAQARFPVTSTPEMRGEAFDPSGTPQSCRQLLAERLGSYGSAVGVLQAAEAQYWLDAFRRVYRQPDGLAHQLITEQHIADLLAEYQRSQVFVDNPWRAYVQGETSAISEAAKQGALLFFRHRGAGGFGCAECHSGDFFTDEKFYNVLLPPLGPGKGNVSPDVQQDRGRWLVTHQDADKFRFRTPSLLNVAVTGPWGHNGAYTHLDRMVKHMLNPSNAALTYDPAKELHQPDIQSGQLQQNLRDMLKGDTDLAGQPYNTEQVGQLQAFLQTLTDPCVTDPRCLAKWIPSADPAQQDPMQLQLNAQF